LGQILSQFINAAALDEASTSPNYLYILFETTALTLRHLKGTDAFSIVEGHLTNALALIIERNVTDMLSYAFQIFALFVANSQQLNPTYKQLIDSIL
jgi:CAS/CSE protein, C-terminus